MATFEFTRPAPFGAETTYRITNLLDTFRMTVIARYQSRITRKALNQLTDRELTDIGLLRADIDRI